MIRLQTSEVLYTTLWILILLNPIRPWEPINKKLKLQIENTLDVVKRAIFKEIVKFTLLKKFVIIPLSL